MSALPTDRLGISVVVPVYRSRDSLAQLVDRLDAALRADGRRFEVILVDDCSPDDSWNVLLALKTGRPWLRLARLLRNSGQHNALLCGFTLARGDIVVTMDDDLQNPPEEVPALVRAIDDGMDLAIGAYAVKQHAAIRNAGGRLIDAVQRRIFGLPASFQLTSFRAARRAVVDNVVEMVGVYPYVTAMLLSHAARCMNVPVRHEPRPYGRSTYSAKRSALLALNLLLTYSSYPLYLVASLCVAAFSLAGAFGFWTLWRALSEGISVPGWATTVILVCLLNALILLALVIQGIYIARLNRQLSRTSVRFTIGEMRD